MLNVLLTGRTVDPVEFGYSIPYTTLTVRKPIRIAVLVTALSGAFASAQSAGPPRADHLPVEPGLPCSAVAGNSGFKVSLDAQQEARAQALYRQSIVITAHDHCYHQDDFRDQQAAGITARVIKASVDGIYFSGGKRYRIDEPVEGWFDRAGMIFDILDSRLAATRGEALRVRRADDIIRAKKQNKIGIIYGTEGARILGGKLDNVEALYRRGLREMQLFWAVPSPLKNSDGTISDFGLAVLREVNRLGIVLDLSHMKDAAFRQAMEATNQPVVASHCAVAAVSGAKPGGTDQLSDDTIRRITAAGGVICLHFYEGYIRPHHGEHPTVVDLVDHVDYIRKLAGIDYVALGVDYFPERGWRWIEGADAMTGMPNVVRELVRRGYSDEEIAKVVGLNLMRVYRKVWK